MKSLNTLIALTLLGVAAVVPCAAQTGADPHEAIYRYQGADREKILIEKARAEGRLMVYTSMAPSESGPLAQAFEKKYGIKVEVWRGLSEGVLRRTLTEAKSRRYVADVVETNGPEMEMLAREKVLSEFYSPHSADLPPAMVPKHKLWQPDRLNFFVVAYNTQKIKREELPTQLEGFVMPKWKGLIGIEATDAEWMGGLVNHWGTARGMDFFKKLSEMKPEVRKGHILLAQLVAAGEVPVGLTIYNANAQSLKQRGANIDWIPVEPTVARPQGIAVTRNAPHPYAALLFADFVISPAGQELLNSMGRPPASTKVKSELNNFKYVLTDPATIVDEADKWNGLWEKMLLAK